MTGSRFSRAGLLVLLLSAALSGCEEFCGAQSVPVTFSIPGTYVGTGYRVGACTDRSPLKGVLDAGFVVTKEGDGVKVETGDACSPLTGKLNRVTAVIDPKACSASTLADSGTATDSVTGGTLSFREDDMGFSIMLDVQVGAAPPPLEDGGVADGGLTCRGMYAGTLKRQ